MHRRETLSFHLVLQHPIVVPVEIPQLLPHLEGGEGNVGRWGIVEGGRERRREGGRGRSGGGRGEVGKLER